MRAIGDATSAGPSCWHGRNERQGPLYSGDGRAWAQFRETKGQIDIRAVHVT